MRVPRDPASVCVFNSQSEKMQLNCEPFNNKKKPKQNQNINYNCKCFPIFAFNTDGPLRNGDICMKQDSDKH